MSEKEMLSLNAWLAEHAMGWKRVSHPAAIGDGEFFWNLGDVLIHVRQNEIRAFRPTTDGGDALMLLEKCAEKSELLACIYIGKVSDEWIVGLDSIHVEEAAATLPLAICKFAKAAKHLFSK